jgi:iron complex transport system substrate-binding protein
VFRLAGVGTVALAAVLAGAAVGCARPDAGAGGRPAATASPAAVESRATRPPLRTPARIIAVAPSAVELLFALGLGDRVVGVGDYVSWPPEATRLPRLGGLLDPRLETVAALRPDLAVLLPSERELGERLVALGVEVLEVPHETLADVERAAERVAARAGDPAAGQAFVTAWRRDLAPAPLPGKPRVALVVARQPGELGRPLMAGPGSFLAELLDLLGVTNAFADAPIAWPQVALEEVVSRDPEILVELQPEPPSAAERAMLVADWGRLPALTAVRSGRIVILAGDHTMVPGPRLPRLYRELRAALLGAAPPG